MTTETMSVHKALCDLKLLSDRIEKQIYKTMFVTTNKKNNEKIDGKSVKEYENSIRDDYQSVTDLIKRYTAIKKAVAQSNAETTILVAGKQYTVTEAMAVKNAIIPVLESLRNRLSSNFISAKGMIEMNDRAAEEKADEIFINSNTENKKDIDLVKIRNDYLESLKMDMIDPLDVTKKLKELDDMINDFMLDIDSALSVSNAVTEITIEY